MKILIVDDQYEIRRLLEVTLAQTEKPLTIIQASNGREAVCLAKSVRPDLILMDIMMPGEIDGIEATRLIKSSPDINNCKVVILTAKPLHLEQQKCLDAGADDFFEKTQTPLRMIKLVEGIRNLWV